MQLKNIGDHNTGKGGETSFNYNESTTIHDG